MSEYTPTTEDVRFAMAGLRMSADRFVTRDSFDRWLAAHDAEVQAQVVAEEPEWEYTRQAEANGWTGPAVYRDEAHASDGLMHGWRVVRRRKAGPWVPLEN